MPAGSRASLSPEMIYHLTRNGSRRRRRRDVAGLARVRRDGCSRKTPQGQGRPAFANTLTPKARLRPGFEVVATLRLGQGATGAELVTLQRLDAVHIVKVKPLSWGFHLIGDRTT